MKNRTCSKCGVAKLENNENFRECHYKNGRIYFYSICKICIREITKNYNKEHKKERRKYQIQYYKDRPNYSKTWKKENKDEINKKNRDRLKNDINFRLRKNVSRAVSHHLKRNKSGKNNQSIMKYLFYTVQELKLHLESLFEPWMNWNNLGKYNKENWDDNNSLTWTWQIDHITPCSDLLYKSMGQ